MRLIIPLIIIAICVGTYFAYINPVYSEIRVLLAQKNQYMDTLAKAKELKNIRDSVLETYNAIPEEDIERLNKILPDTVDPVLVALDLNTIASRHALVFTNFKASAPDNVDANGGRAGVVTEAALPYKTTVVTFEVRGSYGNMVSFLRDIETNLRLMDVTSMEIKSGGVDGSVNSALSIGIEVRTYSLH